MSSLRLRVQKRLDTSMGAVASLRRLTDEFGRPATCRDRRDIVIPASDYGAAEPVVVSPGLWLVEATLPSGELIAAQVDVAPDKDVPVVLQPAEHSPREWLRWQHLLGNIENESTLELMQERARKAAHRLAREALGKSADPIFVERLAASVAVAVGHLWRWVVFPFLAVLRYVTKGTFTAAAKTVSVPIEQEIVKERTLVPNLLEGASVDSWSTLFLDEQAGAPQSPAQSDPDIATSVYNFERPLRPVRDQPVDLLPREFAFVSWKRERYAVSLPLPWPAPDGNGEGAAQVMVRRLTIEGGVQIGVAVLDRTFGPLAGFMTPAMLPKAAVVVEQAYDRLLGKADNPLAAAAGGYVLAATGGAEERNWRDWVGNLEHLYPELPDSGVLRGTLLLRYARNHAEIGEAREALLDACDRGIPYFSIGVSWLLDGLMLFAGEPGVDERLAKVQRLARRLDPSQAFTVVRLSERPVSQKRFRALSNATESTSPTHSNEGSTAMNELSRDVVATTFSAFDAQPEAMASLDFTEFVNTILDKLRKLKDERFAYYEQLRRNNSKWANDSRRWLALLGSFAFLLTALAATLRFTGWFGDWDRNTLLLVLALYAIMGTINFYEKGTTKTSDYFRHLSVILGIRDLWTKLQFALLDEALVLQRAGNEPAAETSARSRIVALAEAFCNDLNKVSTSELSDWRTAFMTSLTELSETAKKGTEDVNKRLEDAVKAAEKSAADAKVAAETAAQAAQPGAVNLTITGEFDGAVAISVDGVEKARGSGRTIAIESVPKGLRKFYAQANKGDRKVEASLMVDVVSGLQALTLTLA